MGWGNEPPESGEFFFNGRLWKKNSLKGGSNCTELVSSTRKLAPGQVETSKSALVAAVELLFCLPQFGTMSSSVWDNLSTVTATAFPSWISFIFAPIGFLSGCLLLSLGLCLPLFGTMSSSVWDFHTTVTERNPTGANMKEIQLGNAVAVTVERKSQTEEDIVPN